MIVRMMQHKKSFLGENLQDSVVKFNTRTTLTVSFNNHVLGKS